ncbi:MAG TPA: amino acid permease, partial [Myxococcota bacterium]|nr:amino acid permease [Myxococcota bacterium]
QFSMFQVLGPELATIKNPLLAYAQTLLPHSHASRLLNALVFCSILGACFGMLTSNCWNLHTIAKHGHLPGSKFLLPTKNQVPWVALLLEAAIASLIIVIESNQIPLQNMAVFGMTVAYFMCTLAALRAVRSKQIPLLPRIVPALSFLSCAYILWLCAERILRSGASFIFLIILSLGLVVAYFKAGRRS